MTKNKIKKGNPNGIADYREAVAVMKTAILQSQYDAAKFANEKLLMLYYGIGKYISINSRSGAWGTGAIDTISDQLQKEMPGLRGFTARNLRNMRAFYEAWSEDTSLSESASAILEIAISKIDSSQTDVIWKSQFPNIDVKSFISIGFTHHCHILSKCKDRDERLFYIQKSAQEHFSVAALDRSIKADDYHHQGALTNNFFSTLPVSDQAFRAVNAFKDEYLLDFINVEELNIRDKEDIDEKVLEKAIVNDIKNFILAFGKDFSFIRNQYRLETFGVDQYIDLLFFNRALNCLVAVELKGGPFKTSYLGQLSGYLSALDEFEKKEHENPSIGIILCRDMEKPFVDFVIRDFDKPMGVATYKTSKDMPDEVRSALPDIEDLKKLLDPDLNKENR